MLIANPIFTDERVQPAYDTAFVIMPFQEKWSQYIYHEYISPAARDCGLKTIRANEMYGRNVLHDIWCGLSSCRLAIADLSASNVNVFYELGIAHTLGTPTVLLTQDASRIPFDLRTQRMIVYTDDHPGYKQLSKELPLHLNAILAEPINEVHHVTSILGGFIIERAEQDITLVDLESNVVEIIDKMDVVGTRENGIAVNKVVESAGKVEDFECNHRFVYTDYPDIIKMAALFDPPYMNVGDRRSVIFEYRINKGFESDKIWRYDCSVDVESLRFVLRAPAGYRGAVRIVEVVKPSDYDIELLPPQEKDGTIVFDGKINSPKTGATYALRWS